MDNMSKFPCVISPTELMVSMVAKGLEASKTKGYCLPSCYCAIILCFCNWDNGS